MNKAAGTFIFVIGAAVGSLVTWEVAKRKFKQLAREEIDSVKEVYSKRAEARHENEDQKTPMPEKPGVMEYYKQKVKEEGYTDYSDAAKNIDTKTADPRVISPEEFGEIDGYDTISLTYYTDGVLANEEDEPINNVEEIVGAASLDHFGEYEDDSVFVRNDKLKTDYEILSDMRKYSEVLKTIPPKT